MSTSMTDPHNALLGFQAALSEQAIAPQPGELHSDLLVLMDQPQGTHRLTYALQKEGSVVALASFVASDPMNGQPCFNIGYAVDASYRSRGYGKEVLGKAFEEMTNGFRRAGVLHLHVEALVSPANEHSKRLATSLIADAPRECTDAVSGLPALHYTRQLY